MKVDLSNVLVALSRRADDLCQSRRGEIEYVQRMLSKPGVFDARGDGYPEESVADISQAMCRAAITDARLREVRRTIDAITRLAADMAARGKAVE